MKRIKLYAYLTNNLGDDLMVDILLKRYSSYSFYTDLRLPTKNSLLKNKNLVYKELLYQQYGRLNHLLNIITFNNIGDSFFGKIFKKYENSCKSAVYIGGSLFMQDSLCDAQNRIENELKNFISLPLHIIGANFGPYYTEDFFKAYKNYFKKCASITFRDKYSFDLFSNNQYVAYAPDVVLNLDTTPYTHSEQTKNVIISVIDFNKRCSLKDHTLAYEKHIQDCCLEIINSGSTPVLMSFCESEGDEVAINRIYDQLPNNLKCLVKKYFYNGNIGEALEYIAGAKYIVATRFHSMILAIKFNKPFYCIAYNQKIINVLNDLNCDAYILPSSLEKIETSKIFDRYSKPLEAHNYIKESEGQFRLFEQAIKKIHSSERGKNDAKNQHNSSYL